MPVPHKCPNTAFQPLRGTRMLPSPQDGHKPPHNAKQVASRFGAMAWVKAYVIGREKPAVKLKVATPFSKPFDANGIGSGTLSMIYAW